MTVDRVGMRALRESRRLFGLMAREQQAGAAERFLGGDGRLGASGAVQPRAPRVDGARHHERTARSSHALLERGTVGSYDAGSNTAEVQLVGSESRLVGAVPVSLAVPTVGIAGKECLVALLDAHNPADGVVVATW